MLEQILKEMKNYFYVFKEINNISIIDNKINVKGKYKEGQYIRIIGSIFNDGIHKIIKVDNNVIELENLTNEDFKGTICSLAIPNEIILLSKEIEEFNSKNSNKPSSYQAESFSNYSYAKATNKRGMPVTWIDVYFNRLKPYKKMFDNLGYIKEV